MVERDRAAKLRHCAECALQRAVMCESQIVPQYEAFECVLCVPGAWLLWWRRAGLVVSAGKNVCESV